MKIYNIIYLFSITVFSLLFFVHKFLTLIWYIGGPSDIGLYSIDFYPQTIILYLLFLYRYFLKARTQGERKFAWIISIILLICSFLSFNSAGITTLQVYGFLLGLTLLLKRSKFLISKIDKVFARISQIKYILICCIGIYAGLILMSFIDRQQQLSNTEEIHVVVNNFYGEQFSQLESVLGAPNMRNKPNDMNFFYKPNLKYNTYCRSTLLTKSTHCEGVKVYVDEQGTIVAAAGTGPYPYILQYTPPDPDRLAAINSTTNIFKGDYWGWRLDYLVWSSSIFASKFPPPLHDRLN